MNILFDENIPFGREAFSSLGTVHSCPGRAMSADMLQECELLFVRSVTQVDRALLEGTAVRFVATATSGSDHIDKEYLSGKEIAFTDAIGCNANSVAEYIVSTLLTLSCRDGFDLAGKTIGVIGVGHVGALVVQKARTLGMHVLANDPPRERNEQGFNSVPLNEALQADVVTLHVPLTTNGPDPTRHLLNRERLAALRPGTILLQSSRGAVVDTQALKSLLQEGQNLTTVLDVWEGEPDIDKELLSLVDIGTPHIAGYSWISKVRGTDIVYKAACRFLGIEPVWQPPAMPEGMDNPNYVLTDSQDPLYDAVTGVYTVMDDDHRLRKITRAKDIHMGKHFDHLRKTYPVRLEFDQASVTDTSGGTARTLKDLGFNIQE
jgi:erythronate-4-phosphate dehydrogenase